MRCSDVACLRGAGQAGGGRGKNGIGSQGCVDRERELSRAVEVLVEN